MKPVDIDKIDSLFSECDKPGSPGYALGIVDNGKIVYKHGYGMANLEHNIPISSRSVFDIGSTSKQFVAFCIAILEKKGRLNLEDPVQKYIPEMRLYKYPVTLRHLIHHISGIRDYLTLMDLAGMRYENEYPEEEIIGLISKQRDPNFRPGAEFLYCNSGYLLLGVVVKRVSGKSLREFAEENIFSPLGMKNTHFHDVFTSIVKNRASGYSVELDGVRADFSIFDVVGDGGVNTTVEDLFLWDQNFYHNKLAGGGQKLIEKITTTGRLDDGTELNYAHGLFLGTYRGLKTITHGGAWIGYRTEILRFPQKNFSVICLSNFSQANPARIAWQITDICLGGEMTGIPLRPVAKRASPASIGKMKEIEGVYLNTESEDFLEILTKDGNLFYSSGGGNYMLEPVGPYHFTRTGGAFDITFCAGRNKGAGTALVKERTGKEETYKKITPPAISGEKSRACAGQYYSKELDIKYNIVPEKGKLFLERKNAPKEEIRLLQGDLFSAGWLSLRFSGERAGRCAGFKLGAGRVKDLLFDRVG
ncbi:MAG: serine hydrolase domain-containing protein [Elusimicrobiota bacterium]